ncbi:MAG: hypothetical protein PVJ83_01600 [Gammaproteobacteria bacterium]|jgi:hypothetical protein
MNDQLWKVKEGVTIEAEDVARIACALKSLSVYTTMACDSDENPEELQRLVDEGMAAIEKIFEV